MNQNKKILLGLVVLAFILRFVFTFAFSIPDWDETIYANLGYELSENPLHYSFNQSGWSDRILEGMWPKAGFRPPVLPYLLSLFYFFNLGFFIRLLMPLVGALTVFFTYLFGKFLINKRIGLYAAFLLTFLPLDVLIGSKIMTGTLLTFFIVLTILSFWKGYEKGSKSYKILFGLFLALALLTRYTAFWMFPVFLFYFLIRDRNFSFMKDKYFWYSVIVFFLVLTPWLVYGFLEYGNIFGPFFHAADAASYWGGTQAWYFFIGNFLKIFSIVGIVFVGSLFFIILKKKYKYEQIYLLLLWFFVFFIFASLMPHKEQRFLLPIVPVLCILSSFFINKFKWRKQILFGIIFILILSLGFQFSSLYKIDHKENYVCFAQAGKYLEEENKDILIFSDHSTLSFYFHKKEMLPFPYLWDLQELKDLVYEDYSSREIYLFYSEFQAPENHTNYDLLKDDLESNFEVVFRCPEGGDSAVIYKY